MGLDRCHERAPVYDRENRFFQEDFDELKDAGYLLMSVPREFGGHGRNDASDVLVWDEDVVQDGVIAASSPHPQVAGGCRCHFRRVRPRSSNGHMVSWNGKSDLSQLKGKAIYLRFQLKNADLYTIQIQP